MKKILITGGNGFIGKELSKIIDKKKYLIFLLDKNIKKNNKVNNINYIRNDITQLTKLKKIISRIKPNYLIHLAAVHHIPTCEFKRQLAQKVNIIGTENILESLKGISLERFIFASSGAVYDWKDNLLNESKSSTEPKDNYSTTKFTSEFQLKIWGLKTKTQIVIARIFNTIGPNDPNAHLIPDILKQITYKSKKCKIYLGNIKTRRDYIDVRDTASCLKLMISKKFKKKYEILNICNQVSYSVQDIVKYISNIIKIKIQIVIDPKKIRKIDRPNQTGSNGKIKKILKFKSRYSLRDSIRNIIDKNL